jgi:CheY-like chemotaxis protein
MLARLLASTSLLGLCLLGRPLFAEDGLQATELALAHGPDVMFLDIKMPGRTGLEVAEAVAMALLRSNPGPPAVSAATRL